MYRLTVFGGLSLTASDGTLAVGDAVQRRLLLVALAVEAGQRGLPRDRAIALLWPEADEERGRGSLNQLRYTLRRQLDAELLVGTLVLRPDPALLSCDLTEFREAVAAGDIDRASALYARPLLDGVPLGGSAELDEWADSCQRDAKRSLEDLLLRSARNTVGPDAAERWRKLAQVDPLNPVYADGLAQSLVQSGVAAAMRIRSVSLRAEDLAVASPPVPAPVHHEAPQRNRIPVIALALGIIALLAAMVLVRFRSSTAPPPPASTVAVLPFSVRGNAEYNYLAEGMVTLLSAELDGAQVVRPVDGRAVLSAVKREPGAGEDLVRARRVARQLGAGAFVLGDVVVANGRLRLTAAAYRADGQQPVAQVTVEGDPTALFGLVDSLATNLLAGLGAGPDARLTRLAAATTGSLGGLKFYLDGEKAFREGRFLEANEFFRQAAQDTTFALASYWYSVSGWWSDQSDIIRPAADRAVRHSDRMSPRDRLLLQAWDTLLRGDVRESERRYRAVLGVEPENIHASTQLGEVIFHYGPRKGVSITDARPAFERVLIAEPRDVGAMIHLARIAAREKRDTTVQAMVRRILQIDSTGEWALEARTLRAYAGPGSLDDERWALDRLGGSTDGRIWNEGLYAWLAAGSATGARRILTLLTVPSRAPEVRGFGFASLAWLDVADGDFTSALRQLDQAARYDSVAALEHRGLILALPVVPTDTTAIRATRAALQRWNPVAQGPRIGASHVGGVHDDSHVVLRQYLLGMLAIRLGDLAAGEAGAAQLVRATGVDDVRDYAGRAATSLRAQIAFARGQTDTGITLLSTSLATETSLARMGASPFYSRGLERFLLAQMLDKQGRPQEAAQWYATFHGQPLFDIVFYQPARQRLSALDSSASAR